MTATARHLPLEHRSSNRSRPVLAVGLADDV